MADEGAKTAYQLALEKLARREAEEKGSLEGLVKSPAKRVRHSPASKSARPGNETSGSGIDLEKISGQLKEMAERNHLGQISPSVSDAYLSIAKYTDSKGVVFYKEKFEVKDAVKLANLVYDQLSYHVHRRFYGMTQEQEDAVKSITDPQGNSYMDSQVNTQFGLDRKSFEKALVTRAERDEKIDDSILQQLLEDKVKNHTNLITQKIISPIEARHMPALKGYIAELVERYKLDSTLSARAQGTHDLQELLQQYFSIVMKHYSEPSRIIKP